MADESPQDDERKSPGGGGQIGGEDKSNGDAGKGSEDKGDGDGDGDDGNGDDKDGDKGDDDQKGDDSSGDDGKDDDKPKAKWPWIVAGIVVVVFVAVVLILVLVPHPNVETEDAYVTAHYAMVAPRVSGQVAEVAVNDNQPVRAGQLLAALDPRDYQSSLDQARATRASDVARVDQAQAQIARQPALIRQAAAQVLAARARLALAAADQNRFTALADTGAGTVQQHQQADAAYRQAQAALVQAEAELTSQERQLDALRADREAAAAQVGRDDAAVHQAELNLGYTRIVAPIDGTIAQKMAQVGNQVTAGAPMMMVVPLHAAYIMANFRELELRHMRPGQPAKIHLDAYAIDLRGHVESLPPASGATFSPIPPNNATGNFTKIVQRLPVKIAVERDQSLANLLRLGMSVEVTVGTDLADIVGAQQVSQGRVTAAGVPLGAGPVQGTPAQRNAPVGATP